MLSAEESSAPLHPKAFAIIEAQGRIGTLIKLRLQQPCLAISTLVCQLQESGVLQPGTFSLSSVYRLLVREGLDRPGLIAEGSGPTKAFETELANALWMADVALHLNRF